MNRESTGTEKKVNVFRPTVDDCYTNGWKVTWKFFIELLLLTLIIFLAAVPMVMLAFTVKIGLQIGPVSYSAMFLYMVLVLGPIKYGSDYVYLLAARGVKCDVSSVSEGFTNYLNTVLAYLLTRAAVVLGLVFFIIPGIVLAVKLAFVPYLVIERRMDAVEAVKKSWEMTSGHSVDIFLVMLLAIPVRIAGMILLVVGSIPAAIWAETALASMYHAVSLKEQGIAISREVA